MSPFPRSCDRHFKKVSRLAASLPSPSAASSQEATPVAEAQEPAATFGPQDSNYLIDSILHASGRWKMFGQE